MADRNIKPQTDEIASLERDTGIFNGFLTVLENPDKVLRLECGGDITIYDDIGRDPRIGSNLRTRAQAVIGKEWEVIPYSDDKKDVDVAEYVKQVFQSFPFDMARRAILRGGVLKGFAVSEVMWDVSEGDVFIREMKHRAQRRFRFDLRGHLRLLTPEDSLDGIDLTTTHPRKFQTFCFGDEPETPYGVGLGRELYWPWWFKKNGIKFWLQFCERFGSPTAVGRYPNGATPDQKATLLNALDTMRSGSSIIIPDSMKADLIEAARSGSISTQAELVRYMDEEISICILGQTATTQGTPNKLGNETAQENVREDLVKADADALVEYLNAQVVRWLVDYQFPGLGRYPAMWIRAGEEADLNRMAERDKVLYEGGVRFKKSYFVGTYGLAEDEFEVADPDASSPAKPGAEFATAEPYPDQTAIDELADGLSDQELQAQMEGVLKPVLELIERGESFEEILAQLAEAYPDMDTSGIEEMLGRALFVSELWGRLNGGD